MKRFLIVFVCATLFLISCEKSHNNSDMTGSWRLTEIYDKSTNTVTRPPSGSGLDIILTFLSKTAFAGHTFRNSLSDGVYTQTGSQIVFQTFSTTKIGEDEWGQSFLAVLYACSLQSASPCMPSTISVQGNVMKIVTPLRFDITLEKL